MEFTRRVDIPVVVLFLIPICVWININTLLSFILSVAFLLYIYTTYKQNFLSSRGFKGPTPVPFLGDIGKMAKKGFFQMDIDNVKEHGMVFGAYIGNIPTIMISDPEMIREICVKQFSNFTDHSHSLGLPKFWAKTLSHARGDHWKYLRSTISPAFSTGKLRNMDPIVEKCLDNFESNLERNRTVEGVEFDISTVFAALTMDIICCSAFGIEVNSQTNPDDLFVKHAKKSFEGNLMKAPVFLLNFLFPEFKYIMEKMGSDLISRPEIDFIREATRAAIKERKSGNSECNDLLQVMIDSSKEKIPGDVDDVLLDDYKSRGLTDDELLANSIMFLLVGYDTTASTLTWLAYFLASNSACQDRVVSEIGETLGNQSVTYDNVQSLKYLDAVISETLRLYGPTTRINRQIQKDTEVCGWKLPAGISVTFSPPAVHRLPEYWSDPDKFDPERFLPENKGKIHPYSYIPFGEGPRKCVGMRLALMEVKMATVTLLRKYRINLSEKQPVPPKVANNFLVKPDGGILVQLEERTIS